MTYRCIYYRSVVELQIANRIRWEEEDMKIGNSTLDYTPVNLCIANMCAGEVAKNYSIEDLQEQIAKWRRQIDINIHENWESSSFSLRLVRNCQARIAALSEAIQDIISAGSFQ